MFGEMIMIGALAVRDAEFEVKMRDAAGLLRRVEAALTEGDRMTKESDRLRRLGQEQQKRIEARKRHMELLLQRPETGREKNPPVADK